MSLPADRPAVATAVQAPIATPAVVWSDSLRGQRFAAWLHEVAPRHRLRTASVRAASADASFRRYFRVDIDTDGDGDGDTHSDAHIAALTDDDKPAARTTRSLIVMDAPPPLEDVKPFIEVAARIAAAGLLAPRVLEAQVEDGFLLLTDLGPRLLLTALQTATAAGDAIGARRADSLMRDAVSVLVAWQRHVDSSGLPACDDVLLRRELAMFPEWCVEREYGVHWSAAQQTHWHAACDLLVASALAQPMVAMHRDYMPRNLMLTAEVEAEIDARVPAARRAEGAGGRAGAPPLRSLGILDFQDAVRGPISYDVASLLRDAFIDWDEEQELDWAVRYWEQARKAGLPVADDFGELWRQIEWMGLQRHLKVLGIFCRLKHRDGKPAYCADLPRFFGYAYKVAGRYRALGPLARLLEPLMGATRHDAFY